ncbi:Peptidase M15 [Candidatus Electrothrix laxa]
MNRRSFLALGAKAAVGLCLAQANPAWAKIPSFLSVKPRTLSFYHTHTRECLDITYATSEDYDIEALSKINTYLRDFRTSEVHPIDPAVLDILWAIQQKMCCNSTYEIISGYRSPKTNQQLRQKSNGVAKRSLHMKGKAIDIRITGEKTKRVRDCAISLKSGGVGYYAKSNFVHIDTGRVRTW